jgi:plastocyanin
VPVPVRPSRRRSRAAAALAACLPLAAMLALGSSVLADSEALVSITSDGVAPAALTVQAGAPVTFSNEDAERHRIRSRDGAGFDTGNLDGGESAVITLSEPGTYAYRDERDQEDTRYHGSVTIAAAEATHGAPTAAAPVPVEASVGMADRMFRPGTVTIAAGGSVTFVNDDDRQHTATGGAFDSGILDPGASFTQSFAEAGSFPYVCLIHPDMTGTVEVVAAPAEPVPPAAGPAAVTIVDFAMSPASLTVPAGTEVTFTNEDQAPHTATAVDGSWDSGIMSKDGTFAFTFDTPDTYDYFCAVHPSMTGVIVVEEAAAGAPATDGGAVSSPSPAP